MTKLFNVQSGPWRQALPITLRCRFAADFAVNSDVFATTYHNQAAAYQKDKCLSLP
ncbi:MAG: hypothetical protein ACE3L7_12515 [Candidatus Pristimantibacillus sp.]